MILEFMERHLLFARGQIPKLGRRGHEKYKKMWAELSSKLNHCGPTIKCIKQWQSVS